MKSWLDRQTKPVRDWFARQKKRVPPFIKWPMWAIVLTPFAVMVVIYYVTVAIVFKATPFWRSSTYTVALDGQDASCHLALPTATCDACAATVVSPSTLMLSDDRTKTKTTVVLFGISTLPQSHPLGDAASKALTAAVQDKKISCAPSGGDHVCSVAGLDLREVMLASGLATVPWYLAPSGQGGMPAGASACSANDPIHNIRLSSRLVLAERTAQLERVGMWWDWNSSWDARTRDPLLWRQGRDASLAGLEAVEASRGQAIATLFTGIAAVLTVIGYVWYKRFTLERWSELAAEKERDIVADVRRLWNGCRDIANSSLDDEATIAALEEHRKGFLKARTDYDAFIAKLSSDNDALLVSLDFGRKLAFVDVLADFVQSKGEISGQNDAVSKKASDARQFAQRIVGFVRDGGYEQKLR